MKLSIKERILLSQILPKKGRLIEMSLANSIAKKVMMQSSEIEDYEIKDTDNGGVTWNPKKAIDIDVEFTISEREILKGAVNKLDESGEISIDLLPLCDKILTN